MKPIILCFVRYYLPGYKSGGPLRTIANMVEHLGDEFEFRIVTSDRDATDTGPYTSVAIDTWNTVGKAQVFYASPRSRSLCKLARLMRAMPHDVLYLNSFFDPIFSIRPLLLRAIGLVPRRPTIIAPRGEFAPGALALKSWKKMPYLWFAKWSRLYTDLTWQASSQYEAEDIQRVTGLAPCTIRIAPDLPSSVPPETPIPGAVRNPGQPLQVLFLSRIAPNKNLDFALRVLTRVSSPVEFHIYGPIRDPAYWRRCQGLVKQMPPHIRVKYHGPVHPSQVAAIMASHHLFFLPTKGENYGHVIPEALAVGTPVLIANTTPWRNLRELGVGWDLPLDSEEQFAQCVEHCARMSNSEYVKWRQVVRAFAIRWLTDRAPIEANRKLFRDVLGS